jgi:hypothetical protein
MFFDVIMIMVSIVGCLILQWKISSSTKEKKLLKSVGNYLLFVILPAIFVFLTLFIMIVFKMDIVQSGDGAIGWLYVIYIWLLMALIPIKAVILVIVHFIAKAVASKKDKKRISNNQNNEFRST